MKRDKDVALKKSQHFMEKLGAFFIIYIYLRCLLIDFSSLSNIYWWLFQAWNFYQPCYVNKA